TARSVTSSHAGWDVQGRGVVALFASHKEAMYQDLVDNEAALLGSDLVRAVALGPSAGFAPERFDFEEADLQRIDQLCPPENSPLVLDADASQRQAIAAAVEGRSFVLDGPPGTGKSQTITNMIAGLMHAGRSVLFVSEKAAALDVVHSRLKAVGLDSYAFALHSHSTSRKAVAQELGKALTEEPKAPKLPAYVLSDTKKVRESLSDYAAAMNESRHPLERSLHDVIGRVAQLADAPVAYLTPAGASGTARSGFQAGRLDGERLADILRTARGIADTWRAAADPHFAWRGLRAERPHPRPMLEQVTAALADLVQAVADYQALSTTGAPITDHAETRRLIDLLATLPSRPNIPEHWLTVKDAYTIEAGIDAFRPRLREAQRTQRLAERLGGPLWQEISPRLNPAPGQEEQELAALRPAGFPILNWTEDPILRAFDDFSLIANEMAEADRELRAITSSTGLSYPQNHAEALDVCTVVELARAGHRPPAEWFDPRVLNQAHAAADRLATTALAGFAAAGARTRQAREAAVSRLGMSWDKLPDAVRPEAPASERALDRLQPAGLDLSAFTRDQAVHVRALFGDRASALASAQQDADRAARSLGVTVPSSTHAADELCALIDLTRTPHRPLAEWLDPQTLLSLRDAADDIATLVGELGAARNVAEQDFTTAVLDAEDFPELAQRLAAQRNPLGTLFSGQRRADRRRAAAMTVRETWNGELTDRLDRALDWREKHHRLLERIEEYRELLGRYADTVMSTPDVLRSAVDAAIEIHRLAPDTVADPAARSRLAAHLADGAPADAELDELGQRLRKTLAGWATGFDLPYLQLDSTALTDHSCDGLAQWLRAHTGPLDQAIALLEVVEGVRGTGQETDSVPRLTVAQAREAVETVREARAATAAFESEEQAHRGLLGSHYNGFESTLDQLRNGLDTQIPMDRLLLHAVDCIQAPEVSESVSEGHRVLGRYGDLVPLDLGALASALDTADRLHALAPETLADVTRRVLLTAQLADGRVTSPELLRQSEKLRTHLSAWRRWAERDTLAGTCAELSTRPVADAADWFQAHLAPLEDAASLVRSVRRVLADGGRHDSDISLAQCRDVIAAVVAARRAESTLAKNEEADRELLGGLYQGADTDSAALHTALDWAHRARRAADGRQSAPLRAEAAHLLCEADPDPGVARKFSDWERLSAQLVEYFSRETGRALRARLEESFDSAKLALRALNDDTKGPDEWRDHCTHLEHLRGFDLGALVRECADRGIDGEQFPDTVERAVLQSWIEEQLAQDPRLRPVNASDRDQLVERFQALDRQLVETAHATVIEACNARRPRRLSSGGQAGEILRQSQLKQRHMPVRELLGRTRDVVKLIKPCFMMSPLTVSQFLPADFRFDVVIFDEASQVRPQDAINCVYRGDALIVAGDQKQLPPTSFFSASDEDEDDDDWTNDSGTFESILDVGKASGVIRSIPLRWHYRSMHEDLITFSNRSFYENSMVTFPGALEEGNDIGVAFFKVDGVYDRGGRRDNRIEADAVAQRVIHHFATRPGLSLGVVALSQAQAQAIEEAVQNARAGRPDLDRYFNEDRLDGFFVKNLETVQGDERDVMILSIGYGPSAPGARPHGNFGPINKDGGWRRLNVAATRARRRMEVVASFDGGQLPDQSNPSVQHLKRFLLYAQSGPAVLEVANADPTAETESPFEEEVYRVLTSWGYEVQPQVGVAGYRIDLGVRDPGRPGVYALGVECDGAMYHSSRAARDRDRLRESVLRGLGWRLHRIWGTDWYRNRAEAEARLRQGVEQAIAAGPVSDRTVRIPDHTVAAGTPEIARSESVATASDTRPVTAQPVTEFVTVEADDAPESSWSTNYRRLSESELIQLQKTLATQHRSRGLDLTDPGATTALVELVHRILNAEGPIHIEVLYSRVRDAWQKGRSGKVIQDRISSAVTTLVRKRQAVSDGQFIDLARRKQVLARRPGIEKPRKVEHVPIAERHTALTGLVTEIPGITVEELVKESARFFGWSRVGPDIRTVLLEDIESLTASGAIAESATGLTAHAQ
ncbi:DUF3320 domain-containing protein, partial [Actinacidiphila sp. bgisy160]|uniref:DUF3320 domain-containing protein n=1 Tax=Actinacidiphila sp. bgisy160 TaxID=3413796 RepID=UPI003D713229